MTQLKNVKLQQNLHGTLSTKYIGTIKILQMNIRSINKNIDEFLIMFHIPNYDIDFM